ncbi:hypothetical protein [Pseudarthrobacter sulfonivorans]|uniref:hypothetical protein n=1 Tax=Pseudarthrobacter sulfonivorans TaxID=121292 RepID=UPI00210602E7|nr:hypothetical protein [Pseudarthrobacter sulfonivorans]
MSNPQEPHQPAPWPRQPQHQPQSGQPETPDQDGTPGQSAPDQYTADQYAADESAAAGRYAATGAGTDGQYGDPTQYAAAGRYGAAAQHGAAGQPPADGPFGLPGEQPPAPGRRRLWTILGVAGGVLLLVILGVVILVNVVAGPTNHARGLADDFTKLVIAGDSSQAYDLYLDPALQKQVTKEEFLAGIKSLEMDGSCKPTYNNVSAGTENGTKAADVAGLIACSGGKDIDLVYRFEGTDDLKMVSIKIKPKA